MKPLLVHIYSQVFIYTAEYTAQHGLNEISPCVERQQGKAKPDRHGSEGDDITFMHRVPRPCINNDMYMIIKCIILLQSQFEKTFETCAPKDRATRV